MPVIKNISNSNIILSDNKTLSKNQSIMLSDEQLLPYYNLISSGMLEVVDFKIENNEKKIEEVKKENIDFKEVKIEINKELDEIVKDTMESLFAHYFMEDLTFEQVETLKWFYQNIGPTSTLSHGLKAMLNDVKNGEELTEILLNHLYPALLKKYIEKSKD